MQNTTLPIQLAAVTPAPVPARASAAPKADARQFSHALSREMEQRPRGPAAAAKPQGAPKEAAAAPPKAGNKAEDDDTDASAAAAIGPVTDMLALVASFSQPGGPTPAPATDSLPASVAAQRPELPAAAGQLPGVDADADADTLSAAAAGSTAAPVADGKQPAANVKPPIEGAVKFAMNIPGGAPAPDAKPQEAAPPSILESAARPRAAAGGTAPNATAAKKPDADAGIAPVAATRTDAAPALIRADAAPARAREAVFDAAALKEPAAALQANAPVTAPVQQASLAMAQAITGAPTDRIAARVGTPGWDNQVGQKIIWMVAGKEQTASLTLNPPDMGPMQVVLSVTGDQASVTFTAAQPEVRQALEAAMPKLREMMGESGIALGNASVNAGGQDGRQAQQGEQPRSQAGGRGVANTGPEAAPISLAPARQGTVGSGMVDTFA
ncbi:MAG: hypothetical protein JWR40_1942 [Massilia sp.]|nr:hypothetical protein [Massilia sp.]